MNRLIFAFIFFSAIFIPIMTTVLGVALAERAPLRKVILYLAGLAADIGLVALCFFVSH